MSKTNNGKRMTIYDIAKALSLSPGTISKCLNQNGYVSRATRKKVLEYVKEIGFVPHSSARILKSKKSWTIGIVFTDIASFGLEHSFFGPIIQAFKNYVEEKGYEIVFIVKKLGESELTYYEWCKNKNVDGILILTGDINDPLVIELAKSEIPSVSTDIIMDGVYTTISDDKQGIKLIFELLLKSKVTKIGAVSGPLTSRAYSERTLALKEILEKYNFPWKDEWFLEVHGYSHTSSFSEVGKWIMKMEERPEAIIGFSDEIAIGTIRALQSLNISVPNDIQVTGFDNINFSSIFTPSLTTISQNKRLIAEKAAEILISLINNKDERLPKVNRIPVELFVRNSTKN